MAMERYEEQHSKNSGEAFNALAPDTSLYSPPGKPDTRDQGKLQQAIDNDVEARKNFYGQDNHDRLNAIPTEKHADSDNTAAASDQKPFYGIDTPFIKLGFSDWSFKFGADVGVAKFGTSLGKDTGVEAGAGLPGLVFADGHAGVAFDENGMHGRAGGRGDLLKQSTLGIGAGAAGRFSVGTTTGAAVDQNARAIGFHQSLGSGASVSAKGLNAGYDVNAGVAHVAGVKNGLGLSLGSDSYIEKNVGLYAGSAHVGAGAGIDSGGNEFVRPNVHVEGGVGADKGRADLGAQVGPGADLSIGAGVDHIDLAKRTENGMEVIASAGLSGAGAKIIDLSDGQKFDGGKIGFGAKYASNKDYSNTPEALDTYNAYKIVEADRARESERSFARIDESASERPKPMQVESDRNPLPEVLISDQCEKQESLQPILMEFSRGATIYDIARAELVDRSRSTGESVDNDSIFRECNRIMVNSGFPDAHLEDRINISMANLPKAWNSIRNGQILTLYSSEEMKEMTGS